VRTLLSVPQRRAEGALNAIAAADNRDAAKDRRDLTKLMATAWKWSQTRLRRFIARLRTQNMIDVQSGNIADEAIE
jgi:hypothetical protein